MARYKFYKYYIIISLSLRKCFYFCCRPLQQHRPNYQSHIIACNAILRNRYLLFFYLHNFSDICKYWFFRLLVIYYRCTLMHFRQYGLPYFYTNKSITLQSFSVSFTQCRPTGTSRLPGSVFFFRGTRVVSYDLQLSHFVG